MRFFLLLILGPVLCTSAPQRTDILIYGATPAGIVTAVRAAREGLRVMLVSYYRHLGGMPSNGLGLFDTLYSGARAPLLTEFQRAIDSHYPHRNGTRGYEPHVAEAEFDRMLAAESRIRVVPEYYPVSAVVRARRIQSVTFHRAGGDGEIKLEADAFVDASYVGDLAKIAGAEMVAGRESRDRYGEPHAGVFFAKLEKTRITPELARLNLTPFPLMANTPLPGSTGAADKAVQAYNYRVCLTRDPRNRISVEKPAGYERSLYLLLKSRWKFTSNLPNQKTSWNAPLLIAGNFDYPDGTIATRRAIEQRHKDLALGLLWFLQNDDAVPEATHAEARQWGLPKDEFIDNDNFPWEVYIREARRLVGRYIFTELDAEAANGIARAPIHEDSIAITEWSLDSHSCHWDTSEGSDFEGKVLLSEETRPGQIPYRALLPKTLDNLLVTGTVSSSHVGWGTIRLEPTWMHLAESAAYALTIAKHRGIAPAEVPPDELVRTLASHGIMVTFFNDFDMSDASPSQRAAQYFGTQGFFPGYDAQLDRPLSAAIAKIWVQRGLDPMTRARLVAAAERDAGTPITATEFAALSGHPWRNPPQRRLTRGAACAWLFTQREIQ